MNFYCLIVGFCCPTTIRVLKYACKLRWPQPFRAIKTAAGWLVRAASSIMLGRAGNTGGYNSRNKKSWPNPALQRAHEKELFDYYYSPPPLLLPLPRGSSLFPHVMLLHYAALFTTNACVCAPPYAHTHCCLQTAGTPFIHTVVCVFFLWCGKIWFWINLKCICLCARDAFYVFYVLRGKQTECAAEGERKKKVAANHNRIGQGRESSSRTGGIERHHFTCRQGATEMGLTGTMGAGGGVRGGALTLSELMLRLQKTCVCFILVAFLFSAFVDKKLKV